MNSSKQPNLPVLNQPPPVEVREVASQLLAGVLAKTRAQGGIVASMETVRGRNGEWRIRIRWPRNQNSSAQRRALWRAVTDLPPPREGIFLNLKFETG